MSKEGFRNLVLLMSSYIDGIYVYLYHMYMYIYVYIYVYMYVYILQCTHTYMLIYISLHVHLQTPYLEGWELRLLEGSRNLKFAISSLQTVIDRLLCKHYDVIMCAFADVSMYTCLCTSGFSLRNRMCLPLIGSRIVVHTLTIFHLYFHMCVLK